MLDTSHTPKGVKRTAAHTGRAQVLELQKQLAAANARADKAEREAYALATFIQHRANASVWDHADVMQMLQDTVVTLCAGVLQSVNQTERKGLAPSYAVFRELVITRFETARATLLDRVGHNGERGAINGPELVSDRMKEDLKNVVRLPKVA
jgi:protein-arginine kinase activator protein McsA